jgi:hypothetical protein
MSEQDGDLLVKKKKRIQFVMEPSPSGIMFSEKPAHPRYGSFQSEQRADEERQGIDCDRKCTENLMFV